MHGGNLHLRQLRQEWQALRFDQNVLETGPDEIEVTNGTTGHEAREIAAVLDSDLPISHWSQQVAGVLGVDLAFRMKKHTAEAVRQG